ncbi:excalibur calcium-binding domain-containing protein [Deinococcus piscis]
MLLPRTSCALVRCGQPGYREAMDRDKNGVACE